jgi:hypothetical protein
LTGHSICARGVWPGAYTRVSNVDAPRQVMSVAVGCVIWITNRGW